MLNECVRSVNSRLKEEPKMVKPHLKVKKSEVNRKRCCWNLQTNGYAVVHKLLPCRHLSLLVLVISLMAASPLGAAQNNDEPSIIRPTPALRLSSADELTTVLLVNNDGMGRLGDSHGHGRYLSVRPEVGLLTSTARTFIQEGITTEYATQVVGTTLDNGRLYAQYLKKSSRVLYENGHAAQPSVVTSWVGDSSRSFLQSHNDLFNADASNWRDIDDSLDNIASVPDAGEFVGNTDFFKLKELSQSLPVDMTIVAASTIQVYKKSSDFQSLAILGNTQDTVQKLEAQKVFYMGNLPTFTVKNHFEPSGHHTIEKADGAANLFKKDIDGEEGRSAKVYYKHLMLEQRSEQPTEPQILNFPKRVLSTVTYYGFANFTTIVGDSVIVFSPSSVHDSSILGHVTSIMGMATLRTTNVQAPVSTSADNKDFIESITNDSKTADVIESTSINNVNVLASFSSSQSNPENNNFISETATPTLETINKMSTTQYFQVNKNKSMLSLPTDQEIQEIFASLSKAQTNESINNNNQSTDSHIHGHIGATTIFTDDDPFANFIEPTRVINNDVVSKVESTAITHIDKAVLSSEDSANKTNKKILSENGILVSVSKLQVLELTQLSPIVQEMTSMYNSSCDHEFPTQMTTLQDVQETTKYNCIQASQVKESMELEKLSITTNTPEFDSEPKSISDLGSESKLQTAQYDDITTLGTLVEATTEETTSEATTKIESSTDNDADNDYVTESESNQENDNENEDYENELDEVDLIYKTLYTTYTYLTTFFQGKSSTVSSHTEILTNVITSEVGSSEQQEDLKTAETISRLAGDNEKLATETFSVTKTAIATLTTSKYIIPDELDSILYSSANDAFKEMKHSQDTTYLDDTKYTKTFFTTYTYYTTIFADSETEIMSRTEVFTNYITGLDTTTETAEIGVPNDVLISSTFPIVDQTTSILFMANTTSNVGKEEKENITLVTDVRSSSSSGDQQLIGQLRDPVDDQVSSESNTEEILPSATLLLQTSFTTFTFYTTMYMADITNVVSRLETVTNIATETVQPIKLLSQDESTLPITYFTTFTYWTKLAKDGEITTISREETISNVIEPTKSAESETLYASNSISDSDVESYLSVKSDTLETTLIQTISANPLIPHSESDTDTGTNLSAITTYYTTYTYYTTSYEANNTVTDSRLETITNIITPTIAVEPTPSLNLENIAQLPSTASTSSSDSNRSDLILFDYKHIIDADRVSTLYFTTKIQSSINEDGNVVELTSSTSSLYIDESKKLNLGLSTESIGTQNSDSLRQYKTGLVRLIEGTRIGNSTTTLYQSKVIGTIIDNRYAQIIESTSSFLFEKSALLTTISPSVSQGDAIVGFTQSLDLESKTVVEGTMNSESTTEIIYEEHDDTIDDENNNNNNARTPFQTKKHSFAPVIRPFASRNRPTFAPKQKIQSPSSATIITRSDITPTITATPALKSVGRFGSSRRGSFSNAPNNPHESNSTSSLTSRRQFGRPSKTSSGLISPLGTSISSVQANNGVPSRNRFASTFRTSQTPNSRRPSLSPSYRPSSSNNFRVSALNGVSSRQRIKPTSVSGPTFAKASADRNIELENSTEDYQTETTDEEENATENIKRNQNPLLRFRRPLSRPIGFTAAPRGNASPGASTSPRRNPFAGRAKVTSTTTTTTTTTTGRPRPRSFQRPTISSLQTRPRPQNNLFPPRGLFQIQQQKDSEQLIVDNSDLNQNESESENDSEYDDEDDDTEGDGTDDDAQLQKNRRRRSNKNVQAQSPVNSRVRRQADTLNRSRFRLRRPKTAATEESKIINIDEVNETTPSTPRAKVNSRFGSRFQSQSTSHSQQSSSTQASTSGNRSIRPTRPTSPRTQFTLREKDTTAKSITRLGGTSTSNFRRQQSNIRQRTSSSPNSRRLKSYNSNHNHNTADTHGLRTMGTSRSRNSNVNGSTRGRGSMRGRIRNEYNQDSTLTDLGSATITVTHIIPAEVTVPVVNGQVTEYRNIVTGKTSLEILGPNQYTKVLGNNGQTSLLLTREDTSISPAGVTEITRYFLHDSTTTTVTFTPTTIRGRKTSFSHVLPSTVYSVENVVSTAQPQISANAPLANILLSQLLLGNINLPANQLLGALGQPQGSNVGSAVEPSLPPPIPQPLTEYRTHTSTYVTTIYDGKSTILPITFQGKKILTTVFDTTAQTITATEYSVDTIINTPTQQPQQQQLPGGAQVAQVNSLLLQQLLLQQQQQQIQQVSHTAVPQIFLSENLQELDGQLDIDLDVRDNIDDIIVSDIEPNQGHSMKNGRKKSRKPGKSHKRRYNNSYVNFYATQIAKSESTKANYNIEEVPNIEIVTDKSLDEARFNLATHIMSNGVELIIASDRVKYSDTHKQSHLYQKFNSVPSSRHIHEAKKPVTFAPSTLLNHMILTLPTAKQEKLTFPINENQFITKTCLTTYTYHSTYLHNGSTTVESIEKVVSNRHTEERNYLHASTHVPMGVTLLNTPDLVVGIFPTTYHYYNKFRNNEVVFTSSFTIINTVTGPEDYISFLQPSEEATPLHDTNTYYSRLPLTNVLGDGFESTAILTAENILTQVVITESVPAHGFSKLHSVYDDSINELGLHIYATKTILTTITNFSTPDLISQYNQESQLKVTSDTLNQFHTKVIKSVTTDVVPSSKLALELVSMLRHGLMENKVNYNRTTLTTLATLLSGQTIEITAVSTLKRTQVPIASSSNLNKYDIDEKFDNVNTIQNSRIQTSSGSKYELKPSVTIKHTSVQNNITHSKTESDDLNVAESAIKDVYIRPLKDTPSHSSSSAVDQFIGSFNFERFRPVLNVMADLIQKNIVSRHRQQTKHISNLIIDPKNQTVNSQSPSTTDEGPNYIPLQISDTYNLLKNQNVNSNLLSSKLSPDNSSTENKYQLDTSLSRLSAHSLHINPPELDISDGIIDDVNIYRNYIQSFRPTTPVYQQSILNNGIPIRPGEVINANADIIIGKPNGIGGQFSRPGELDLLEYRNRSAQNNIHLKPSKKKTWNPSMIPLSLMPPHIIPLTDGYAYNQKRFYRVPTSDNYNTMRILRPPSQTSKSYTNYISTAPSVYLLQSVSSISYNKFGFNSPIHGSEQQIANLNSELNNNEILEIKQIPQIFSTKFPAVTKYPIFETTQLPSMHSLQPVISGHHRINLKIDVLSHNVNMNVPPLTFKRDTEHFPVATAVRGHIAAPPMPLIKIPLNKANIEVRLTSENTHLAVKQPEHFAANTFKQRNQNLSKTSDGTPMHRNTSGSTNESLYSKLKKPYKNLLYFSSTVIPSNSIFLHGADYRQHVKSNISEDIITGMDSNPVATNKKLMYVKYQNRNSTSQVRPNIDIQEKQSYIHEDQAAEFTTFNLKNNLPNRSTSHMTNTKRQKGKQSTMADLSTVKTWPSLALQNYKSIGLGQPFIKLNVTELKRGTPLVATNNPKKLYVASGETFNLRSQLMSESVRPLADSTKIYVDSGVTVLSPPPIQSKYLPNILKNSLIYETKVIDDFEMQPLLLKPSVVDKDFISILTTINSRILSTPPHQNVNIQPLSIFHGYTKNSDTPVKKLNITDSLLKSISHKFSVTSLRSIQRPLHKTNSNTNILVLSEKLFTKVNNNKTLNTLENDNPSNHRYISTSHSSFDINQSTHPLLESSEVAISSEINTNFVSESINSKSEIILIDQNVFLESVEGILTTSVQPEKLETTELMPLWLSSLTPIKEIVYNSLVPNTSHISVLEGHEIVSKIRESMTTDLNSFITSVKVEKSSDELSSKMSIEKVSKSTYSLKSENSKPDVSKILVVMSKASGNESNNIHDIDYESNLAFEMPTRDEEIEPLLNSNSVLIGSVLISATSKTENAMESIPRSTEACKPSCKSTKNEICVHISVYESRCECRMGFARIFPDRPCKPTYTYEMKVPASRVGSYSLKFNNELFNSTSSQYRHLSSIILDAVDRMVMQSDFRDEYYGVQLKEFSSASNGEVIGNFLLQLSENSDETRLETVFKKYLRQNNYSIGGTEMYTSKESINLLTIQDFNECDNATYNDCSLHAQCFNLVGSYTCICPDNYADISENPIYPGRHCSDKLIGCDKCNYHGNCFPPTSNGTAVCKCFAWYTGVTCQLNLKILLICLIVIVTVFVVLLVCVLFIYARRKVQRGSLTRSIFITTSNYHPSLLSTSRQISPATFFQDRSAEKHAILNDSNSDSSHYSDPYIYTKSNDVGLKTQISKRKASNLKKFRETHVNTHHKNIADIKLINRLSLSNMDVAEAEQSDRSLTVMIPRARYFNSAVLPQAQEKHNHMAIEEFDKSIPKRQQTQLNKSYNDKKVMGSTEDSSKLCSKSAELVSAGYEVSAIISDREGESNDIALHLKGNENDFVSQQRQQQISKSNLKTIIRSGEEIQKMSSWMGNIHSSAISADVRSFDETTVEAVTKSMHLCFDIQAQNTTNEEPNTMTERDLGSTFLLPHTHLYMPEKLESELSGFDSI